MNNSAAVWSIVGIVVGGFIGKQMLEWLNQGRFKPMIDLTMSIAVFLAVSGMIIKGIQAAKNIINSIPN